MPSKIIAVCVLILTGFSAHLQANPSQSNKPSADPQPILAQALERFRPYLGKTYRAEFEQPAGKPKQVDISRWERHLNGQAIRIEHSINQGEYGGEAIIFFDKTKGGLRFFYFTTAGFYTEADVIFEGNKMISTEQVSGNSNGITQVKSVSYLKDNGDMLTESKYLKNGKWILGRKALYKQDENATVVFK